MPPKPKKRQYLIVFGSPSSQRFMALMQKPEIDPTPLEAQRIRVEHRSVEYTTLVDEGETHELPPWVKARVELGDWIEERFDQMPDWLTPQTPAKKTAAKRTARKTTAKKTTAKRATAKKTTRTRKSTNAKPDGE